MLAAGTAGVLDEMAQVTDLARLGAIVTKSITADPRDGNRPWRVAPLDVGMLNAVGLANPGVDGFLEQHAARIPTLPCPVVVSVAGFRGVESYTSVTQKLAAFEVNGAPGIQAIELNVSCPNVDGGASASVDPDVLAELIRAVRPGFEGRAIYVKLSPIVTGKITMTEIAKAAIEAGADALTISNTVPGMAIDPETREPVLGRVAGGLSGPAVHPIALKLVHDVYRAVAKEAGVPIIGAGGVTSWREAASFVLAGASAVQIGTASFANPGSGPKVASGLAKWARRQRAGTLIDLIGSVSAS